MSKIVAFTRVNTKFPIFIHLFAYRISKFFFERKNKNSDINNFYLAVKKTTSPVIKKRGKCGIVLVAKSIVPLSEFLEGGVFYALELFLRAVAYIKR